MEALGQAYSSNCPTVVTNTVGWTRGVGSPTRAEYRWVGCDCKYSETWSQAI
jgi:hypothetical protein